MDLAGFDALRTTAGLAALATAADLDHDDPLRAVTALRGEGHDPTLAADALDQARLRARARSKFGADADRMFFTTAGLEQATRSIVAAHRAHRFAEIGARRVLDVGCGIGGDLLALARAGASVHGVELDPLTAHVARANATVLELDAAVDVARAQGDGLDALTSGVDAAFCDPARRRGRRRVFDPAAYSPPFSFLADLAARVPDSGAKVAPGIEHELIGDAEAEWVSVGGELVETALWFGGLRTSARRRATLLPSGASLVGHGARAPVGEPGQWLYEPDAAVVRAHLVAEFAELVSGRLLDPTIAYVTADSCVDTLFGRAYEVTDVLPFSAKRLRAVLRERSVGAVTIKKRGTAVTPEQLRPQLKLSGDGHAVVVLTRIAGRHSVLLCRDVTRLEASSTPGATV